MYVEQPDLIVIMWGTVIRGADAFRRAVKDMFDKNEMIKLDVNEVTHLTAGDGVIGVGTATYQLHPLDGPHQEIVEKWSDLRRKIHGRWVFVLDHATKE